MLIDLSISGDNLNIRKSSIELLLLLLFLVRVSSIAKFSGTQSFYLRLISEYFSRLIWRQYVTNDSLPKYQFRLRLSLSCVIPD